MRSLLLFCTLSVALAWTVPAAAQSEEITMSAKAKRKKPQVSVAVMFKEGTDLYNKGQFGPAMVVYTRILQRYPGHEPSRVQLAKTLYRLEKIKEAYNVFKQLNPAYLDPETAYEYGLSSFKQNDFEAALAGFNRVTQDHPLRDLACYYGAIAAYKLKRYQEALDLIEGATVLPSKLVKSRELYRKNILELRQKEQEEQLRREKALEVTRLKAETRTRVEELEEKDRVVKTQKDAENKLTANLRAQQKEKDVASLPEFDGFQEIVNQAGGGVDIRSQAVKHSATEEDNQFTRAFGEIHATPLKRLGRASGVGLSVLARLSDREYEGREIRFDDSEESALEEQLFPDGKGNDKWIFADAYVFGDAAVGPMRLGANLGGRYLSRDFKGESTLKDPYGTVFTGMKVKNYEWKLFATYGQTAGEKSSLYTYSKEGLDTSLDILPQLKGLFNAYGKQWHYAKPESAEGPDSEVSASVGLEAQPWTFLNVGASYLYRAEKDVRIFDLERAEAVVFNAQSGASKVYIQGRISSWLFIEGSASRLQNTDSDFAGLSEEAVQKAKGDSIELASELRLKAVLNLIF